MNSRQYCSIYELSKSPESSWGCLAFSVPLKDNLSFPHPFGGVRIVSLKQQKSARSTECPHLNQLCTTHCEEKNENEKKERQGQRKKPLAYPYTNFGGVLTIPANLNFGQNSFKVVALS